MNSSHINTSLQIKPKYFNSYSDELEISTNGFVQVEINHYVPHEKGSESDTDIDEDDTLLVVRNPH